MFTNSSRARHASLSLAAATLLATGAVGFLDGQTNSAQAAGTQTCTGTIANRPVGGDLRVPAGASCTVSSADIQGDITVGRGATLTSDHTLIRGSVALDQRATFSLAHVEVQGELTGARGSVFTATGGGLNQGISGRWMSRLVMAGTVVKGGVDLTGSPRSYTRFDATQGARLSGGVDLDNVYLHLDRATVTGSLSARGGNYHYISNSSVSGNLNVRTSDRNGGISLCGNTVRRDVNATSASALRFGSSDADSCGGNVVRGDVDLRARTGAVNDNVIYGDAFARINRVSGDNNRVRGDVSGNFPG